jgi:ribosomal protein S6--L-glutamate ligase
MHHLDLIDEADVILFPDYADINLICLAMGKTIFPSLSSYLLGYNKVEMTRAFQSRFAAHVPLTMVHPDEPRYRSRILDTMQFPFVAKYPRSTRGEGVFLIESDADWHDYCRKTDMLYVQEKLEIDRDLRVIWIGDRIVHAYWRIAAPGAFHNNLAHGGSISLENIPGQALTLVENIATRFRIDYAGFDVAMVGGHPYVFEFNRLFGLEGVNREKINTGSVITDYLQRHYSKGAVADHSNIPSNPVAAI